MRENGENHHMAMFAVDFEIHGLEFPVKLFSSKKNFKIRVVSEKSVNSVCPCVNYMYVLLQGGRLLIRLGDSDIDYDKNFKYVIFSLLTIKQVGLLWSVKSSL